MGPTAIVDPRAEVTVGAVTVAGVMVEVDTEVRVTAGANTKIGVTAGTDTGEVVTVRADTGVGVAVKANTGGDLRDPPKGIEDRALERGISSRDFSLLLR